MNFNFLFRNKYNHQPRVRHIKELEHPEAELEDLAKEMAEKMFESKPELIGG